MIRLLLIAMLGALPLLAQEEAPAFPITEAEYASGDDLRQRTTKAIERSTALVQKYQAMLLTDPEYKKVQQQLIVLNAERVVLGAKILAARGFSPGEKIVNWERRRLDDLPVEESEQANEP